MISFCLMYLLITPIFLAVNILIVYFLRIRQDATASLILLWKVTTTGFKQCSLIDGRSVTLLQALGGLVLSEEMLALGNNYFIGEQQTDFLSLLRDGQQLTQHLEKQRDNCPNLSTAEKSRLDSMAMFQTLFHSEQTRYTNFLTSGTIQLKSR